MEGQVKCNALIYDKLQDCILHIFANTIVLTENVHYMQKKYQYASMWFQT